MPPSLSPGLAEQLVQEVKRLQQELSLTKTKLATAEELIHKMPSEGVLSFPSLPPSLPFLSACDSHVTCP